MQGTMSNLTPDDQQGELQGVLSAVNSVAASISPLVMTYIFYRFTEPGAAIFAPGAPFLLAAALMVVCVLVLVATPPDRATAKA
jgi:DHA1 family tetracycline resistance protein-like MFS transporter